MLKTHVSLEYHAGFLLYSLRLIMNVMLDASSLKGNPV